jgi:hypothetical protein
MTRSSLSPCLRWNRFAAAPNPTSKRAGRQQWARGRPQRRDRCALQMHERDASEAQLTTVGNGLPAARSLEPAEFGEGCEQAQARATPPHHFPSPLLSDSGRRPCEIVAVDPHAR